MAQLRYHFSEILLNLLSNQPPTIYICPLKYAQVALREHHNPWEFLLTKCLVHLWFLARISVPFPSLSPKPASTRGAQHKALQGRWHPGREVMGRDCKSFDSPGRICKSQEFEHPSTTRKLLPCVTTWQRCPKSPHKTKSRSPIFVNNV